MIYDEINDKFICPERNKFEYIRTKIAKKNLTSEKGKEMRGKRAEYSEGIFGQIKWNMGFKRFMLRGLDKVDPEWGLLSFALNIIKE